MFYWCYVWTEEGGWVRIRRNAALEHLRGEIALPRCRDGFVRLGCIAGRSENRVPLEVTLIDFTKQEADARGFMTEEQQHEQMDSAMDVFSIELTSAGSAPGDPRREEDAPGPTVVDATAIFARRRYDTKARWKPSRQALEEFCRLVNTRAKRALIAPR